MYSTPSTRPIPLVFAEEMATVFNCEPHYNMISMYACQNKQADGGRCIISFEKHPLEIFYALEYLKYEPLL